MKKIINIAMSLIIVILGVAFASCSKSDEEPAPQTDPSLYCGTWTCISSTDTQNGQTQTDLLNGQTVTINADGTYTSTSPAVGKTGRYVMDGNKITVTTGEQTIIVTCTFSDEYKTMTWDGNANGFTFHYVFQKGIINVLKVAYTHAVDLGLPSGIKWADMNVGAEKPEDYGWYLAWGETEEKSTYDWSTYKWCKGSMLFMTKYGAEDCKTILDIEDDAAHVNWGGNWRMPTEADLIELYDKCTWTWTTQNGVTGCMVTGPNGKSIFLPAAGDTFYIYTGQMCSYMSSSVDVRSLDSAVGMFFLSGGDFVMGGVSRDLGTSVRPVCDNFDKVPVDVLVSKVTLSPASCILNLGETKKLSPIILPGNATNKNVTWTSSNPTIASVDADGTVTARSEGKAVITCFAQDGSKEEGYCSIEVKDGPKVANTHAIDLGLSVKWADMNVGAKMPEDYGSYFAWGMTEPQSSYVKDRETPKKTNLDIEDDAAHVNWGGEWRMPTKAELDELRSKCTWTKTTQNGVTGCMVTGPNGNSIFLPAAGYYHESVLEEAGTYGYYRSSPINGSHAYFLSFVDNHAVVYSSDNMGYFCGYSVRPVCPK